MTDAELKMCERFKQIRQAVGVKQAKFAKDLAISVGHASDIANKRKNVSDRIVEILALKYNVNENWLRTGDGEMFVQHSRDEEIARFFGEVLKDEKSDFRRRLIHALSKLSVDEWDMIERRARELLFEDDEAQKKTGP